MDLNRLTGTLRDVCKDHILNEKWLLAPSKRVGFQWLDRVVRSEQPVLNVRVKTLRHMALELASPEMDRQGVSFLHGVREEVVVDRIFSRLKASGSGYLAGLDPSPGLLRAINGAVRDLRVTGLSAQRLRPRAFEVTTKGLEIQALLTDYEKVLKGDFFRYTPSEYLAHLVHFAHSAK